MGLASCALEAHASKPCADANAAFVGSKVAQYLSEELGDGASVGKRDSGAAASDAKAAVARRQTLLAVLTQNGASLLAVQLSSASHYLQQGMAAARSDPTSAETVASKAAIGAALDAAGALAAWLPMSMLRSSSLLDACGTLVRIDEFKAAVLEIIVQVCAVNGPC